MPDRDYEDVTGYGLDAADEAELLARQVECTFIWGNAAGHPVGVIMNYVFRDGRFWLTASGQRARVAAVRRDPRVAVAVSSRARPTGWPAALLQMNVHSTCRASSSASSAASSPYPVTSS